MIEFIPKVEVFDQIELLLKSLPKELENRWRKVVEDMDNEKEALSLLERVTRDRKDVEEKMFTHIQDIKDPEVREEVREVIKHIEETFGNKDYYVGEGSIAKVYYMPYAPHVCVKYIVDKNMFERHGNTPREEVQHMVDLNGFSFEGIKVPIVYFEHMPSSAFGMQRIDGMSLDKIIEDPESCEFLDKIKEQDMKIIIDRMKKFFVKLHEEKKIVHRDVATRNIMVDRSGNWYVIDFGKAKRIEIGDDSTVMSEQSDIASAESTIRNLFSKIN